MIAGAAGGGNYNGEFLRGDGSSIDLDISAFTDPNSKNAADLVTYAIHAWESGWGYVWGTYGDVLTESLFAYKLDQYPDGVGSYEDFIRANWLGGRTTDCVGLIKGYGWLNAETMKIQYGTHGMPDIGANQMRVLRPLPSRNGWAMFISTYFSIISSKFDCGILSMLSRAACKYIKGTKRKLPFAILTVLSSPAKS